jgi:hypothetical protein
MLDPKKTCPDCGEGVSRRSFMKSAGMAAAAAVAAKAPVWASTWRVEKPEALIKRFHESLKPEQKQKVCFGWDDEKRTKVSNNWDIVEQKIGLFYTGDQQQMLKDIFKGITSEDGWGRFQKQMQDDYGGFEKYTVALFGDPATDKFEWVLAGRHLTLRCDASAHEGSTWGAPIFYGHAVTDTEKPDHPGNVFWKQAQLANKVFAALDGKQQEKALLEKSPADDPKTIKIKKDGWVGLCVGELSKDQKGLVEETMKDLLAPYRESDVASAMALIKEGGGLDKIHIAFYQDNDLGGDKIWDRWKLEGPTMSWYFRGSPHVHTWVNIAKA